MSSNNAEVTSIEESDAADREQVDRVEAAVLRAFDQERPATISDLSSAVRRQLGDIDNSVIRAAILRLLNRDQLKLGDAHRATAG
jgi:hypothetical protein